MEILLILIASVYITVVVTLIATYLLCCRKKKGVPNPKIKEFEAQIDQRGLILSKAKFYRADMRIKDTETFLSVAKRNGLKTIFKEVDSYQDIHYFYILKGKIVSTKSFPELVKPSKTPILA